MNTVDQELLTPISDEEAAKRLAAVEVDLQKLEKRDWWLWIVAMVIMLLLTFAVFSMSFPQLTRMEDSFYQFSLNQSVQGLIALVLLFNAYTIYQQVTVKRLRRQASTQIAEMRVLHARAEQFQRLAIVDPLTGLYNRRVADERLAAEASRSQRYGHPLTVVFIDLDKFKQINDTYGHLAGDEVLKEFGSRLYSAIRLSDFAARMGGDEFLVLLPECDISRVGTMLERLRGMEVIYEEQMIPVNFSAGWVGYEQGESTKDFLERADRTLYAQKRAGKVLVPAEQPA